jgi:hypothetical protein
MSALCQKRTSADLFDTGSAPMAGILVSADGLQPEVNGRLAATWMRYRQYY